MPAFSVSFDGCCGTMNLLFYNVAYCHMVLVMDLDFQFGFHTCYFYIVALQLSI
jgi:hypothetical protein